ncbi:unnamed protein product [Colletotrichum noveboracense]|uniref:Uncharacterized protein n=1 Tax=Colletotrichum noveboracense TaxID=2664923 RepID=A0A9W4WLB1_9PEZI|nr:unnamed protein product [Colletotrichum noveboracense]
MDFDPSWSLEELGRYRLGWERSMNFEEHTEEDELDDLRWEMYDCLAKATREMYYFSNPTVWLVDHRLRRKSTVLDEDMTEMVYGGCGSWPKEQLVFHAAGCKYYAMPEYYARELCGYDAENEPEGDTDAFDFMYELEELGARQEAFERRGEDEGSGVDEDYYVASVRLLIINLPSDFLGMSLLSNRAPRGLVA